MKYRVTNKQLKQLPEKSRKKLATWWQPQKGDLFASMVVDDPKNGFIINYHLTGKDKKLDLCECDWCMVGSEKALPRLSIGQMIQLIDELAEQPRIGYGNDCSDDMKKWGVSLNSHKQFWQANRLCDALWDATRYALEF